MEAEKGNRNSTELSFRFHGKSLDLAWGLCPVCHTKVGRVLSWA